MIMTHGYCSLCADLVPLNQLEAHRLEEHPTDQAMYAVFYRPTDADLESLRGSAVALMKIDQDAAPIRLVPADSAGLDQTVANE